MNTEQLIKIELDSSELIRRLDVLKSKAVELSIEWVNKHQAYRDIEKLMPSKLATIQTFYKDEKTTMTDAKTKALASQEYKDALMSMNEAERQAELVKCEYRIMVEAIRALGAIAYVRNSEIKLSR